MKIVSIIGVGLIGGSFALYIKALFNEVLIQGIDHNTKHISQALSLDIIQKEGTLESISQSDLIVLAVPVNVTLEILPTVLDKLSPKGIVVDMGSTKAAICQAVD